MEEIKKLAKEANHQTWTYLQTKDLGVDEEVQMLGCAYASLHLWIKAGGSPLNLARGHWLISRVCSVLGEARLAARHAKFCEIYTNQAPDRSDFDNAYCAEALARAAALNRDFPLATTLKHEAKEIGDKITDTEDRGIFFGDLESGPWFGI